MSTRIINAVLLVAVVIGTVLAYRASVKHRRVIAEFQRLSEKVGLPNGDPSKIHVRPLRTDDDLSFAWRVYIPANHATDWQLLYWPSYSNTGINDVNCSRDLDFIAWLSLREREDGVLEMRALYSSTVDYYQWGKYRSETMRGRWNELQIEQMNCGDVIVLETNEIATLLRVTLPDHLENETRSVTPPLRQSKLLEFRIGSKQACQQEAAEKGATGAR